MSHIVLLGDSILDNRSYTHGGPAIAEVFELRYGEAVRACQKPRLPLSICTIYNGNFPDPSDQRLASTALMAFNRIILRVARGLGLAIVDLSLICVTPEDYANPIEPSSIAGAKVARAIVSWACGNRLRGQRAEVIAG